MSSKTRIIICDDHTLFVEGIKAMFRNESSLEFVGEARDGRRAEQPGTAHLSGIGREPAALEGCARVDGVRSATER